jgi:hypothetical protein
MDLGALTTAHLADGCQPAGQESSLTFREHLRDVGGAIEV